MISAVLKRLPTSYTLTDKGKALAPIIKEITLWGLKHIPGTDARLAKEHLKKKAQGQKPA